MPSEASLIALARPAPWPAWEPDDEDTPWHREPPAPPAPLPPFRLGQRIPLPPIPICLGRHGPAEGVHLTLEYRAVSRYHALLTPGPDGWAVEDLYSRNRTYLNRRRLQPLESQPLLDGDVLAILDYWFLFATEPFDYRWLTADVVPLARGIRADRAWDRLPILGDALQDAGCGWAPFLAGCKPGQRLEFSAWVVELLLYEAGDLPPVPSPLVADADADARPPFPFIR